jgi:2'-5' RNA ligase
MEEKTRAFIAIELEPEIKSIIFSFENKLIPNCPSGLRWVNAHQLHLTLKFLRDITPHQVEQISKAISQVANENHTFTLKLAGTGAFPNWRNPRTLWISINKSEALTSLFKQLEADLTMFGFLPDVKSFSPHLTLCRVSDHLDPRLIQPLQKEFEAFTVITLPPWKVHEMVFFKSQLKPGGPIYTPITKYILK